MHGLRQPGSRSGKHPDPPKSIATYRTQEKASREKIWVGNNGRLWSQNWLRTGVGHYRSSMKKWGLVDCTACECGEPAQTADLIINSCPLHGPLSEAGLFEVGPLTRAWLQQAELTIWYDDIRKKRRERDGVPKLSTIHPVSDICLPRFVALSRLIVFYHHIAHWLSVEPSKIVGLVILQNNKFTSMISSCMEPVIKQPVHRVVFYHRLTLLPTLFRDCCLL